METEAPGVVAAPAEAGSTTASAPPSGGSWRRRGPAEAGSNISSKGDLQMADQFIRDHFTLFLWIPTEQVGIVIGKKGAKIQYIQGATKTRVVIAAQPGEDWDSTWFQVMVKGPPSGCYQAFKMISGLVDEVDDCVASFPIPRAKHSLVIGKNGTTIRTISADTNVRIYVPGKKEEAATNDIQLEGEVNNVMKAVTLIMTAVYSSNANRGTPANAQQASKSGEENQDASGEGQAEVVGEKRAAEEQAGGQDSKGAEASSESAIVTKPQKVANDNKKEGVRPPAIKTAPAVDESERYPVERTIVVTLSKLRVLISGKKSSALMAIGKATGTKIIKEPKPKTPTHKQDAEGVAAAEGAAEGGGKGDDREAASTSATQMTSDEEEEGKEGEVHEEKPEDEGEQQEKAGEAEEDEEEEEVVAAEGEEGEEEEEEEEEAAGAAEEAGDSSTPAGGATASSEEGGGAAAVGPDPADPEIKIFIRGPDSKTVDAAVDGILAVADGQPLKDLIIELRNRFGKAVQGNNNGGGNHHHHNSNKQGGGSKPSKGPKGPPTAGGRQGGAQGRKVGGGRGGVQVPRRSLQVAPKTT